MKFRHQSVGFATRPYPFSGGYAPFLFKRTFLNIEIGKLIKYLADSVLLMPGSRPSAIPFQLLNVCSTITDFSHGVVDRPPESALPSHKHLVFTFKIRAGSNYDPGDEVYQFSQRSINVTVWNKIFVSVGLDATALVAYALPDYLPTTLQYLFNTVGPALKNMVLYPDKRDVTRIQEMKNLARLSLGQILNVRPYGDIAYSLQTWKLAPNLIRVEDVTPQLVLHYLLNVRRSISIDTLSTYNMEVYRAMREQLSLSVMSLITSVNTVPPSDIGFDDLLAPLVIHSLAFNGSLKMSPDIDEELARSIYDSVRNALRDKSLAIFNPTDSWAKAALDESSGMSRALYDLLMKE